MTDRDRLIELLKDAPRLDVLYGEDEEWQSAADFLLANGVIVPPCKVGQMVYYLSRNIHTHIEKVKSGKIVRIAITGSGVDLFADNYAAKLPYGKRSFLTKEEAENALKGSVDNG